MKTSDTFLKESLPLSSKNILKSNKENVEIPSTTTTDNIVDLYSENISKKLYRRILDSNDRGELELSLEEKNFLENKFRELNELDEIKIETPSEFVIKKGNKSIKLDIEKMKEIVDAKPKVIINPSKVLGIDENNHVVETETNLFKNDNNNNNRDIRLVNKNAYELRNDIIEMAIEWIKFKTIINKSTFISDEEVLGAAKMFYSFVENRRQ
jgi:hypothetical protein